MATKTQKERRRALRPHPVRDQILDALRTHGQPLSPTRLAEITGNTLGSTAYHVRTLVSAGVVTFAAEGRVRGAVEHFYTLVPDDADDLQNPVTQLLSMCNALTVPGPDGSYPRATVIDDEARDKLTTMISTLVPRVQRIALQSTLRADKRDSM